jgi:hypothetical protein
MTKKTKKEFEIKINFFLKFSTVVKVLVYLMDVHHQGLDYF